MNNFSLLFFVLLISSNVYSAANPIKDNMLFAFEKCKSLAVDLEKGQLKEAVSSSFDLHCIKVKDSQFDFLCDYFDTGSNIKLAQQTFSGGSELGVGELQDKTGKKIKFLIGKNYASYESGREQKVCVGIFIFEQDALKQKASSPKSDL